MSEFQQAEKGDIFCTPENVVVRVARASRSGTWVDIEIRHLDGSVAWTKRMPAGIPASWARYPR